MTSLPDASSLDATLAQLVGAPRWFVACSGGLDSVVLLDLLLRWREGRRDLPPLYVLHVDHGLQAASSEWAEHCRALCEELGVPIRVLVAQVQAQGGGLEEAAREARYALLEAQLQGGDILFTGHHLDDQVETFFLRLMRGAGLQGLAAMPAERALGAGRLLRPLLSFSREQLEAYARSQGLRWVEDPSNADASLDRNYLRREVLPLLEARWPAYRQTVARASGHLAAAQVELARGLPRMETLSGACGDPGLALACLGGDQAGNILRAWLRSLHLPAPDAAAQAEFLRQLREGEANSAPMLDTGAYRLQRYRDAIYLLPEAAEPPPGAWFLGPGDAPLAVPGVGLLQLRPAARGFLLAAGEALELRWRSGGERCRPAGRAGAAGLKQLLQEAGIPPWWRNRVPMLYLEEELLAIGGIGNCHSSRLSPSGEIPGGGWELRWESRGITGSD